MTGRRLDRSSRQPCANANPPANPAHLQYRLRIQEVGNDTGMGIFSLDGIPQGALLADYTGRAG
jgi:hypothetical protein